MKNKDLLRLLLVLFLWLLPEVEVSAEGKEGKRVVIINSYHDSAPWSQEIVNPIVRDISKRDDFMPAEVVFLSNTLIHNEQDFTTMEEGLFGRFTGKKPDYVVLVGNFAFTLRDRIVQEWGNVPMLMIAQSDEYGPQEYYYTYDGEDAVGCGNKRPLKELQGKYNFSLVVIPNLYKETIDMMKYMFPDMKKLVFLADALYLNRHLNHEIRDYMKEKYPGIEYEWLVASDENGYELQNLLNNRDLNVGVLLSTWFFERMTIHGYPQLMAGEARSISAVRRPVFGLRYAYFGYGIFGGYFPSPEEFEEDLMTSLEDLVGGRNMATVPFKYVTDSYPIINYEKLVRNKIPESACPPDTVFLNKPKTLWEQYYAAIISLGVLFIAIVVVTVIYVIYQRRKIEFLRDRDNLVGKMPIGYSQATMTRNASGEITDIEYHGANEMYKKLLRENEQADRPSKLFDNGFISEKVKDLLKEGETIRFSHHFDRTDSDYEFLASIARMNKIGTEELEIFAIDITDQKKKEAMLIEAREKAMESDKLKMAFLANMSHEIRTPLNAIVGFSRMLCKTADEEKKKRFVDIIDQNNDLLLKLINDVLDTAKVESNTLDVHFEMTDINSLLTAAENTVRLRLPRGIVLNLVLGVPECKIITDPDRVSQIVINLLTNALKFTERGFITLGYELRPDEIYFYVRDTGKGIDPDDLGKLFTRFSKLNNFVQGTGLGLSISKSLVERLGGTIGASSAGRGRGSLFWFTLPLRNNEKNNTPDNN